MPAEARGWHLPAIRPSGGFIRARHTLRSGWALGKSQVGQIETGKWPVVDSAIGEACRTGWSGPA